MKVPEQFRITRDGNYPDPKFYVFVSDESYGNAGAFFIPRKGKDKGRFFFAMVSDMNGWQHVSVSVPSESRCPTWEEMCHIKSLFWDDEETVMQLHPPRSEYINNDLYTLHLWKPDGIEIPLPPSIMVGYKHKNIL